MCGRMEEKTTAKELDSWIARLEECKQLEEKEVRILCNKVGQNNDRKADYFRDLLGNEALG